MSTGRFSAVTVGLLLTLVFSARARTQSVPAAVVNPAPTTTSAGATFVGAKACAKCHREESAKWKGGRHSKMLQPATPSSVKGDFGVSEISLHRKPFKLREENGEYYITESNLTGREQEHHIDYTLGSRRIQHYLTTVPDGRMIILTPSWDVQRRRWFDNMEIVRPDQDAGTAVQQWNKNCFGCHVSQQENNYKTAAHTYATRWMDYGTSCERCHGPGSAHVEAYSRAKDPSAVTSAAIVRPTKLDPKTSSMICAQCHSFRDIVAPGYTAGSNYYDYFLPLLEYGPRKVEDPAYWADGRPRRFSNDAIGFWESECFLKGSATCTSCHRDPHEPDVDRNPQLAAGNNALCTRCHQQIGAQLTAHTRHRVNSAGSSCVECHMPKTVVSIKSTMRDHSIGVPAPENSVSFGIPNACTECHKDKKASWAVDALNKWYPQGRRMKLVARAETFTAARAGRPEALDRLIAMTTDESQGPLLQANAAGYLSNYPDQRAVAALLAAIKADQPVIRATAVSSLGRLEIASSRAALLNALDDPVRAVRLPALLALVNRRGGPFNVTDQRRVTRVSEEFAVRAGLHEDDATIQRDLGLVRMMNGEFDLSAEALVTSLGLEPEGPSSRFLLALARIGQKRVEEARALLMQVTPADPAYGSAQESLKRLDSRH